MKIALLGVSGSGKTVYFSSLYHRFRNVKELPHLTPHQRAEYHRQGVNTQVGFRLSVKEIKLDGELAANASLLTQRPMDWPEKTDRLNNGTIDVQFDFVPLHHVSRGENWVFSGDDSERQSREPIGHDARSYMREIEFYDPAGGAFTGENRAAKEIEAELQSCDMAIAFLPIDKLLDVVMDIDDPAEIDDDLLAEIKADFVFGRVTEVMQSMNKAVDNNDMFPVCFVLSKSDLIPESKIELVNRIVYDRIIVPFSKTHKKLMVCACSISVVDADTGYFKAKNLEWPFLFAAGSTILRNSYNEMEEADEDFQRAEDAQSRASEIAGQAWWRRAWLAVWEGERESAYRERAREYTTDAGRKVKHARDDKELAHDIWSSVAAEQKQRGVHVFLAGESVDPRIGVL